MESDDGEHERGSPQGAGPMVLIGIIGILVIVGFLYTTMAR